MINFPDTPTLAQIFTTAGSSWQWDGNKWEGATVAGGGPYLLLTGGTISPGPVIIRNTASPPQAATVVPQLWLAADTGAAAMLLDVYGTAGNNITARRSRGTAAAPASVQSLDTLFVINGQGRGATTYSGNQGQILLQAAEAWSDTAQGTQLSFSTTPIGTTAQAQRVYINRGVVIGNPAPDPGQGGLVLNANAAALPAPPAGSLLQIGAADGSASGLTLDAFGSTPTLSMRAAINTAASPQPLNNGAFLFSIFGSGYGATAYANNKVGITAATTEAWSDTANGSCLRFRTTLNGTTTLNEAMRIDHNGNVGIGTTAPAARLHVASGSGYFTPAVTPTTNATARQLLIGEGSGNSAYVMALGYANVGGFVGTMQATSNGSPTGLSLNADGGNVGIGTTAPGGKLHVGGSATSGGVEGTGSTVIFGAPDDGYASVVIQRAGVANPQVLDFGVNQASLYSEIQSARNGINVGPLLLNRQGGNVGIGTATPGTKLQIGDGTIPTYVRVAGGNSASGDGAAFNVFNGSQSLMSIGNLSVIFGGTYNATGCIWAQNNLVLMPQGGAGSVGINTQSLPAILTVNGSCANVSGSWSTISDASVKQDIQPYTRGLDAIVALKPVQFRYTKGTPFAEIDKPSRPLFGLIADEVKPHVPEIVGTTKATVGKKKDVELSTLEPGNLIYALINAIKELNAKVVAMSPPPARRKAA